MVAIQSSLQRRALHAALACTLLLAAAAHARDGRRTIDYVAIRCDAAHGLLVIDKRLDAASEDVPPGRGVRTLDRMVGYEPRSRDDSWQFPINDLKGACRLRGADYRVRLHARVFGSHGQGRCGAAPVSVEVNVTRNGAPLLAAFLMGDSCGDTGTADMGLGRLSLSEAAQAMTVSGTLDDPDASTVAPLELRFEFPALPALTLEKVFAARPVTAASAASDAVR